MQYQLIIIGSGPAGYKAAELAGQAGIKTLLIERDKGKYGGTCLNYGCIPTKALLRSAKIAQYVHHAHDFGVDINNSPIKINWRAMQARKDMAVRKLVAGVEYLMRAGKVETIWGDAKLVGGTTVEVNGVQHTAERLIIASGSVPLLLPLPGFDEGVKSGHIITSTEALELKELPKSMVIMGAGVIGIEMAELFNALGVKVTILQGVDRILERLDEDVSTEVSRILHDKGVEIITEAKVVQFDKKTQALVYEQGGIKKTINSEIYLSAIGRKPEAALVKTIGINMNQRGFIEVDKNFMTNIKNVYAIGDCVSPVMLAHVAYQHAHLVMAHINGRMMPEVNYNRIPNCIYTFPEIAAVGKTEAELKAANITYSKVKVLNRVNGKSITDGDDKYGFFKLLVDPKYGEILGCHIVASTASDMIAEIVSVMESEASVFELANAVHPHPTISEVVWDAAIEITHKLRKNKI